MRDPKIRIGFIIFNNDWKEELSSGNGHRKTAWEWIRKHNLTDLYNKTIGKNNIYDEEDFLIEYIGAIKLYGYRGRFYCRIPRMRDPIKSYLKRYYTNLGYTIISDGIYEEEKPKTKVYTYQYNKTIINNNNKNIYNPIREGD